MVFSYQLRPDSIARPGAVTSLPYLLSSNWTVLVSSCLLLPAVFKTQSMVDLCCFVAIIAIHLLRTIKGNFALIALHSLSLHVVVFLLLYSLCFLIISICIVKIIKGENKKNTCVFLQ